MSKKNLQLMLVALLSIPCFSQSSNLIPSQNPQESTPSLPLISSPASDSQPNDHNGSQPQQQWEEGEIPIIVTTPLDPAELPFTSVLYVDRLSVDARKDLERQKHQKRLGEGGFVSGRIYEDPTIIDLRVLNSPAVTVITSEGFKWPEGDLATPEFATFPLLLSPTDTEANSKSKDTKHSEISGKLTDFFPSSDSFLPLI